MRYWIVGIAAVLAAAMSTGAMAAEGCYVRAGIGFELPDGDGVSRQGELREQGSGRALYGCGDWHRRGAI